MTDTTLVRGREARSALPAPVLTIAAGRQHTVESIMRAWRESKSDHTIRSYQHDLEDFAQWLSRALNISPVMTIEDALTRFFKQSAPSAHEVMLYFRAYLLNDCGLASASVNRHIAAIRSLSKLARQLGYCTWSVETEGVKLERRKDTRGPRIEDVHRMLTATSGDSEGQRRDYAIVLTLVCCGLRVSELTGLDWQDVDLQRGTAWILGKMRREKELIALPALVCEAIKAYAAYRGTSAGPLFKARNERAQARDHRLGNRSVTRLIRVLGAKVGLRVWPHALRHTSLTAAVSEGAKAGLSLNDVRAHSRHKSIQTLQTYLDTHDRERTQRQIVELVAGQLDPVIRAKVDDGGNV